MQEIPMTEAEQRLTEHECMIRDLVENDPLFSVFTVVEIDGPVRDGRRFLLVRKEEGSGIQMPEPGGE
jgi:hypothetical protein